MSAIAGLWSFDGGIAASDVCQAMLHALRIYGADECAQCSSGHVSMGRCLLRLLPEDSYDHQPLSADDTFSLIADVRLDNRRELARELKIAGAAQMADSSILLEAWRVWRERALERMVGAFSFAVWNTQEQELFLARDHTGERPLYYFSSEKCFAFASMPKGLHPVASIGAEIDEDYIARYLALVNTPVEQTIFRRILRLPAGCALSIRPGKTRLWRYWRREELAPLRLNSDEEYLDLFRERFDAAVAARLRTTGKIGAQLSGGLDSSSVTATAAGLLAIEGRGLAAFTAVPRPGSHSPENLDCPLDHFDDEGPAAAEVAALYPNIQHILVQSSQTSFLDILDLNNSLYDHPCYSPTNEVWLNAIMARAKESGVTVLLNGNCGNSTLSYYGLPALSAWLRSGRWATLARTAFEIRKAGTASSKLILRNALGPSLPFWLRRWVDPHMRSFSLDYCLLHPEITRQMDLERKALHDLNTHSHDGRTMLSALLKYGDVSETNIAPQGGWQIDFRDPTFDKRVVEFCLTVPLEQFLRGGQMRSLVRRAMVGRLPPSTLARTQRGRQSADWYLSLGESRARMLAEVGLLETSPLARRTLDLAAMRRLLENWPTDGFERSSIQSSYHAALTRSLSVGRFLLKYDLDFQPNRNVAA